LTEEWFARRRRRMLITWGIVLAAFAFIGLAIFLGNQPNGEPFAGFCILLALVLLIVGLAYGQYACRLVYPQKIDDSYVWLNGVNSGFLDRLPVWPYP
jgi:hypothetical protein